MRTHTTDVNNLHSPPIFCDNVTERSGEGHSSIIIQPGRVTDNLPAAAAGAADTGVMLKIVCDPSRFRAMQIMQQLQGVIL